jgi:hypothetical protein
MADDIAGDDSFAGTLAHFCWSTGTHVRCLQYSPKIGGTQSTNGGMFLTGAAGSVGIVYVAAYVHHLDQMEEEGGDAEAKQSKAAERAVFQKEKEAEQASKDADDKAAERAVLQKEKKDADDKDGERTAFQKETEQAYKDADDKAAEQATFQTKTEAEQVAKDADDKDAEQAGFRKEKEAKQAAKDAGDNMRVETLKADKKEEAKNAQADDGDSDKNDKKGRRFRFRFWKKE